MASIIDSIKKIESLPAETLRLLITVAVLWGIGYYGYTKIENLLEQNRKQTETEIDKKIAEANTDLQNRLANIKVINEQKTIVYKETTNVYSESQKRLADIEAMKNKPLSELVDAWNKNL